MAGFYFVGIRKTYITLLAGVIFLTSFQAYSQTSRRVVELSGIVLSRDTTEGTLPGVHVYIPKAGRGVMTNRAGYFSLPVLIADSVVISMVGYKRQHYIVPRTANDFQTIIVEMVEDTTYLEPVEIMAIPTEDMFKEAVLALNVPLDANGIDKRNLNAELLALMINATPMDAAGNYKLYVDQWSRQMSGQFQPRANPFLNPFNWARFIRGLKGGKKKKKKKR